ncbi:MULTISPECIES: hypothetical protein [unclassified Pseudomonas]|uniref:Uncharacterized protein n=1 Tax=Pseudomonas sp. MYb327 TaxID=2745230 RepID=A0AAU8E5H4_9PSED
MSYLNAAAVSSITAQVNLGATALPDKLNTLEVSLADESEVKHYSFTAVRGQDVWINAKVVNGRSLTLEYNLDGAWSAIPWGTPLTVSGLQPNQEVQIRISKSASVPFVAGEAYPVEFGSAPYYTDSLVRGDASQLPLYWATTQVYIALNWSVRLQDSTGHALEGATATLILNKGADDAEFDLMTDSSGNAASVVRLGECYGNLKSDPFWTRSGKYNYQWELEYNLGYWLIKVQGKEASGVGGHNVPNVSLAHICYQRMLRN